MRHKIKVYLLLLVVTFCTFFDTSNTRADSSYLGEISYGAWELGTTGSAKYLDGSTVFVCIFLEDMGASWTEEEKQQVEDNLEVACDFLVEEGERYNKDVRLIYNLSDGSDLVYDLYYDAYFPGSCSGSTNEALKEQVYDMYDYAVEFVHDYIPSVGLMDKYKTDSIAYLVFVDGESDTASAFSYYHNNNTYYEELAFIPLRWQEDYMVNPDTYAHEILHLFGARDLYTTKEINGISKEFVIYTADRYPEDIMLGYATDGVSWEDSISSEISKITAYFIGWTEYIAELEQFPSIEPEYKASFTIKKNPEGNYDEYTLTNRKVDEKTHKANILEFVVGTIISVYLIFSIIKDGKRAKQIKSQQEEIFEDDSSRF